MTPEPQRPADGAPRTPWSEVVPGAFQERRQWVAHGPDPETGKDKVPFILGTSRKASCSDPATWRGFPEAVAHQQHAGPQRGVGFVLTLDTGVVFFDFDNCLDDTGHLKSWAEPLVRPFVGRTYVEVSPSGRGLHVFVRGSVGKAAAGRRRAVGDGRVEVYVTGRYSTVTGNIWEGSDLLDDGQEQIDALVHALHLDEEPASPRVSDGPHDVERIRSALAVADPDLDYDRWMRLGMALHSVWPEEGGTGFQLWDEWSSGGAKYPGSRDLARKWSSFTSGGGVSIGTLIRIATESGWRPPSTPSRTNGASGTEVSTAAANDTPREEKPPKAEDVRPGLADRWVSFTEAELCAEPKGKMFLWEKRIPLGNVGTLAATGGLGKTSLIFGLAVHRAMGKFFLGRPVKQGTTVIVTTEEGREDCGRMLAAWRDVLGPEYDAKAVAKHVHLLVLQGVPFKLVKSEYGAFRVTGNVDLLAATIRAKTSDEELIIVIETTSRVGAGESNEAHSELIVAGEQLRELLGPVSVLFVSHVSQEASRNAVGDAHAARGGTALGDNGRFTITLARFEEKTGEELLPGLDLTPHEKRRLCVLRVPKINGCARPDPVVLMVVPTRWGLTFRVYDATGGQSPEARAKAQRVATGEALRALAARFAKQGDPLTETKLTSGLCKDVGLTKAAVVGAVANAVEDGYVERKKRTGRGGGTALFPVLGLESPGEKREGSA